MNRPRSDKRPYYYATTTFSQEQRSRFAALGLRCEPIHAKEYGTLFTLCGKSAFTWRKYVATPFEQVMSGRCFACSQIARGDSQRVPDRRSAAESVQPVC